MSDQTTPFGYAIPAVRKVSPLRQRMIEDMTVRNFAPNTQESYLRQVSVFARHGAEQMQEVIQDFTPNLHWNAAAMIYK